jgi:hypothetical protein
MKKYLMGAAAVLAVGAPGVAFANDSADIGLRYANVDPDGSSDADIWGLVGAYAHQFDGGMVLQADGSHDRWDAGGVDVGTSYGAVNLGVRNDAYSFYGFIGLSDLFALSATNIGVGGQLYFGQATVNGSVGYSDTDAGINVTNVHVDATWFVHENLGLTGELGFADADVGGPSMDWTTFGLGAAFRLTGAPITLNLNYRNVDGDAGDANVLRLGFVYNIGTSSEQQRSQSGASWNGAENLYQDTLVVFY